MPRWCIVRVDHIVPPKINKKPNYVFGVIRAPADAEVVYCDTLLLKLLHEGCGRAVKNQQLHIIAQGTQCRQQVDQQALGPASVQRSNHM